MKIVESRVLTCRTTTPYSNAMFAAGRMNITSPASTSGRFSASPGTSIAYIASSSCRLPKCSALSALSTIFARQLNMSSFSKESCCAICSSRNKRTQRASSFAPNALPDSRNARTACASRFGSMPRSPKRRAFQALCCGYENSLELNSSRSRCGTNGAASTSNTRSTKLFVCTITVTRVASTTHSAANASAAFSAPSTFALASASRAARSGAITHTTHVACAPSSAHFSKSNSTRIVTASVAVVVVAASPDRARRRAAATARCVPRPGAFTSAKYARLGVVVARTHA
mmetsp:Transcript_7352/g.29533  ORF Transcript_7352/g.29533 Transcript_7352/m.29533 type:complete len:287 (+) Transcript_7352:1889-2749(+)